MFTGGEPDNVGRRRRPTATDSAGADPPDIVAELDYESLTLAQLRARLSSLRVADLEALLALRGRHQVARTVPDPAGQQDHPRDRQVTRGADPQQGKSPDNPWPVRAVATRVAKWIDRLGTVWVEGQLTELNVRPSSTALHGAARSCRRHVAVGHAVHATWCSTPRCKLSEGTQVIMLGKPQLLHRPRLILRCGSARFAPSASASCWPASSGCASLLDAEGLFDPRLKRPFRSCPTPSG